jgi:hypothetical protein
MASIWASDTKHPFVRNRHRFALFYPRGSTFLIAPTPHPNPPPQGGRGLIERFFYARPPFYSRTLDGGGLGWGWAARRDPRRIGA